MKRSEIEAVIGAAIRLFDEHRYPLPAFAFWAPDEWRSNREDAGLAIERGLGWDVTDFDRGHFPQEGLCLFTLRNGSLTERETGSGQTYAEKLMMVGEGQVVLCHLHRRKTEDIINRGGGRLVVQVFSEREGGLGDGPVEIALDATRRVVGSGEELSLSPGGSIHIPAGTFHSFWGVDGPVVAGEVSSVNDDAADNVFLEPVPRFPTVEEDVPASHLLVSDYAWALA